MHLVYTKYSHTRISVQFNPLDILIWLFQFFMKIKNINNSFPTLILIDVLMFINNYSTGTFRSSCSYLSVQYTL
jgi:hypothetical protein